ARDLVLAVAAEARVDRVVLRMLARGREADLDHVAAAGDEVGRDRSTGAHHAAVAQHDVRAVERRDGDPIAADAAEDDVVPAGAGDLVGVAGVLPRVGGLDQRHGVRAAAPHRAVIAEHGVGAADDRDGVLAAQLRRRALHARYRVAVAHDTPVVANHGVRAAAEGDLVLAVAAEDGVHGVVVRVLARGREADLDHVAAAGDEIGLDGPASAHHAAVAQHDVRTVERRDGGGIGAG